MDDTRAPDPGPSAGPGPSWPLVLPLTLLVILGLAGLRGFLVLVLGAGMIAVAVAIFFSLHLHLGGSVQPAPTFSVKPIPKRTPRPQGAQPGGSFHVPVTVILYVLLVVLLVAAVLLSIWWSRRFGPSFGGRTSGFLAEDPEDLREAVESGRLALRTVDDARAAIIACYVAMETSLAERGAARAVADTPDELLARATASGLVRGTAAARLTALFYEARSASTRRATGSAASTGRPAPGAAGFR